MPIESNLRAEVQAFSTKEGFDDTLAEASRQEGVFDGQKVEELDIDSMVADSAEEVGSSVSEKVEKKLSERKAGSKEALRASATDLADLYVNMTAETQSARKFHEFLDALKKMGSGASEADIRQLLGEHFQDASDQYAALSFAEESLSREKGQEALLAKVQSVKAQLMKDAGPAIRSGLNIAAEVMAYARQGLEGADKLRDFYRFAILGGHSVAAIYGAIMDRYGPSQFSQSLEFLLRAAGSDLDGKGLGSSLEPTQLKAVVDDIYHVQALGNLHRALSDVLDQTRRQFAR
ncbi:YopN family type III secretion system gatekeeper subunit [Opitutaceae bacterium EW11]|nr:YopN family type III secretion system gatekeeper subunit [Opitutaceae bacterium EW11]